MTATGGPGDLGDWSQREAVDYEVACELFTGMIAWCSSEIAAEQSKPHPDTSVIERWRTAQARYADEHRDLDPADHAEVSRVTTEYGAALRAHYAEIRAASGPGS